MMEKFLLKKSWWKCERIKNGIFIKKAYMRTSWSRGWVWGWENFLANFYLCSFHKAHRAKYPEASSSTNTQGWARREAEKKLKEMKNSLKAKQSFRSVLGLLARLEHETEGENLGLAKTRRKRGEILELMRNSVPSTVSALLTVSLTLARINVAPASAFGFPPNIQGMTVRTWSLGWRITINM